MSNPEEILAGLSPAMRKKLMVGNALKDPGVLETPSLSLNRALNGGFKYGRQHMVYGNKSSGKSSMLLQAIGIEQKKGKTAAWIDAETTFDPAWAERLGVDTSRLIVSQARSMNDMVDAGIELIGAGIDIFIVDSISTLLPAVYFEDKEETELKHLSGTKQIGAEARDMANAVKMLNFANNQVGETAIMLISQTRNNIGAMYASIVPTGGKAVQFYSSTIVQLFSSESENQAIKGKLTVGDKVIEQTIGRKVNWDVKFSKTSKPFQSGSYDFYFDGPMIGVDMVADLVTIAEQMGFIERSGAWYTVEGERLQGREKVIEAVRASEELQATLAGKVNNV